MGWPGRTGSPPPPPPPPPPPRRPPLGWGRLRRRRRGGRSRPATTAARTTREGQWPTPPMFSSRWPSPRRMLSRTGWRISSRLALYNISDYLACLNAHCRVKFTWTTLPLLICCCCRPGRKLTSWRSGSSSWPSWSTRPWWGQRTVTGRRQWGVTAPPTARAPAIPGRRRTDWSWSSWPRSRGWSRGLRRNILW